MKYFQILSVLAVTAFGQNEFPDPDYSPYNLLPVEDVPGPTRFLVGPVAAVNASVVALDKAIIAFQGPEQVEGTVAAADNVLSTIDQAIADVEPLEKFPENSTDEEFSVLGNLIDYTFSLTYHINHTVVNLVLKKDLAVETCQGPVVLANVESQQTAARTLIDLILTKIPDFLSESAGPIVQPVYDILASASAAFADQTTLPATCTSTSSTTTTTTSSTTTTTPGDDTTTTTTTTGGGAWETYGSTPTTTTTRRHQCYRKRV